MTDPVLIALITTGGVLFAALITAFAALRSGQKKTRTLIEEKTTEQAVITQEIKISIDGRMEELLELNRKIANAAGHAEGKEQERDEERERQNVTR